MLYKQLISVGLIVPLSVLRPVSSQSTCHENMVLYDVNPRDFRVLEIAPDCPPIGIDSWGAPNILWTIEPITQGDDSIFSLPAELMSAELIDSGHALAFHYNQDVSDLNTTEQVGVWIRVQRDQLKTLSVAGNFHQVQILAGFTDLNLLQVEGTSNSVKGFIEAGFMLLDVAGNGNTVVVEDSSTTGVTVAAEGTFSTIDIKGQVRSGRLEGANNQIRIQGSIVEKLEIIGGGGYGIVNNTESCTKVEFDGTASDDTVKLSGNTSSCIVGDSDLKISAEPMEGCTIAKEMGLCNRVDNSGSHIFYGSIVAWDSLLLGILFLTCAMAHM